MLKHYTPAFVCQRKKNYFDNQDIQHPTFPNVVLQVGPYLSTFPIY